MEEDLTLTDRGWPRPVVNGWPIPWISPAEHLNRIDPERHTETVECALCHVCGEVPEKEEWVYLLINLDTSPPPDDLSKKTLKAPKKKS